MDSRCGSKVSIRFSPVRAGLGFLHKECGPDYVEKVVKPEVQAQLRQVFGQVTAAEIFSSYAQMVPVARAGAGSQLRSRHVLLDDLIVRSVTRPTGR